MSIKVPRDELADSHSPDGGTPLVVARNDIYAPMQGIAAPRKVSDEQCAEVHERKIGMVPELGMGYGDWSEARQATEGGCAGKDIYASLREHGTPMSHIEYHRAVHMRSELLVSVCSIDHRAVDMHATLEHQSACTLHHSQHCPKRHGEHCTSTTPCRNMEIPE